VGTEVPVVADEPRGGMFAGSSTVREVEDLPVSPCGWRRLRPSLTSTRVDVDYTTEDSQDSDAVVDSSNSDICYVRIPIRSFRYSPTK